MTFPNFPDKQKEKPLFTPDDFLEYQKKIGRYPKFPAPQGVIFCYQRALMDEVVKKHKWVKMDSSLGEVYFLEETDRKIAVIGRFGIGAPVVVTGLEEYIAFGVKKFISIGTAGALQKNLKFGDIVVCDKAIRDEGVSHHYLPSEKYIQTNQSTVEKIKKSLDKFGQKYLVGATWSIDAPYRETIAEAQAYQKEGVLTVEMEASALLAVAQYRKVEMGIIFTISDLLSDLKWEPNFHGEETKDGLGNLFKVALDFLLQ